MLYGQNFSISRVHYGGGGDWYSDPSSIPNLLKYLTINTNIKALKEENRIKLSDQELPAHPYLYLTGHGNIRLNDEEIIIDLLPQVHRKAYTPNKNNVIPVDFLIINKGKKAAAGHFGKAVKGEFIRYMAENNVSNTDDFMGFEYDGFEWDGISFVKKEN